MEGNVNAAAGGVRKEPAYSAGAETPENSGTVLRIVSESDAGQLLEIYGPYVEETAVTFECETPSEEEFRERIARTLKKYPYIAAVSGGRITGYAYAGPFKARAAYDRSVEMTVYAARDKRGSGTGSMLYEALEEILRLQGILNANACIACPRGAEDEYLTYASALFHSYMGYRSVGEFDSCAYKFGRWYNMIWMEKHLGDHTGEPPEIKQFPDIISAASGVLDKITRKYSSRPERAAAGVSSALRTVTAARMKQIERNAYMKGMLYIQMMENAGRAAYAEIRKRYAGARSMTVVTGKGNNGGDGYVAARLAAADGMRVLVIQAEGIPVTPDAAENLRILHAAAAELYGEADINEEGYVSYGEGTVVICDIDYAGNDGIKSDITVDALYGTGFHGRLRDSGMKACALMNAAGAPVISLDVPSGVSADTGEAAEGAVKAQLTVVFDSYKNLNAMPSSAEYCGVTVLVGIGIPADCHI